MKILETKRKEMAEEIKKFHVEAMDRLFFYYGDNAPYLLAIERMLVEISERMTTRAGLAAMYRTYPGGVLIYTDLKIKINGRLHEMNPSELKSTYLHELAHVVANIKIGGQAGHGPHWAAIMEVMGLKPERRHYMDVSALARKVKRHVYRCERCPKEFYLTTYKHNKHERIVNSGGRGYTCRCGGALSYDGSK